MKHAALSNGEWKLMELLWDYAPRTLGEFVEKLHEETGWTKGTVYTMLKRMLDKKIIRVDESGRRQEYYPVLAREEAQMRETENFLEKVYHGSMRMMLAAMTGRKGLSDTEIDELYQVLEEAKRGGGSCD